MSRAHVVRLPNVKAVLWNVFDPGDGDSARGRFTGQLTGIVRPLLDWSVERVRVEAPDRVDPGVRRVTAELKQSGQMGEPPTWSAKTRMAWQCSISGEARWLAAGRSSARARRRLP